MLVVARYNEDISWTRKYPKKIIYNKGDRSTIPEDLLYSVIDLPNVGREGHTFLHYILDKYDSISDDDVIVFSQGRYDDHLLSGWTIDDLFTIKGLHSYNLHDSRWWQMWQSTYNFRIDEFMGVQLKPSKYNENYGDWYQRLFKERFPEEFKLVYPGAIFSVRGSMIKKYPKELYQQLISELEDSSAPETCHFLERTWSKMYAFNACV